MFNERCKFTRRIEVQGTDERFPCFLVRTLSGPQPAQVVMGQGQHRIKRDGPQEARFRGVVIPGLKGNPAPQIVSVGIVGRESDQLGRGLDALLLSGDVVIEVEAGQNPPQGRVIRLERDGFSKPNLRRHVAPLGGPGLTDFDTRGRVGGVQVVGCLVLGASGGEVALPVA